ncbi:unnamed protein product, partial [Polarella glacialis]
RDVAHGQRLSAGPGTRVGQTQRLPGGEGSVCSGDLWRPVLVASAQAYRNACQGVSLLHLAAHSGKTELCRTLLTARAAANA